MPSVLDQLSTRAQRALSHPMFAELRKHIPASELRDPKMLQAWLSAAAGLDKNGARRAPFEEALGAVQKWQAAQDLSERAVQLYHDPRVIAEFGADRDYYLQHPEEGYAALIASAGAGGGGLAGERNRQLRQDLSLAFREALDLSAEHGISTAEAPQPIPGDPGRRRAEYEALLKESVENRRKFDPEKQQRLEQLAGLIAGGATEEEIASHRKALGIETPPTKPTGEYGALINKSVRGGLSETETARMQQLATGRAVAAGLFETSGSEGQDNDEL